MPQQNAAGIRSRLNLNKVMLRYSVQSGLLWVAWCPIAYASTFMLGRGLSPTESGTALAIGNMCALLLNPLVSSIADSDHGLSMRSMAVGISFATCVSMGACIITHNTTLTMAAMALTYLFAQNLPSLSNSINVYYVNRGARINYGLARGIGSLTWSVTSAILGMLITMFGNDSIVYVGLAANIAMTLGFTLLATPKNIPVLNAQTDTQLERDQTKSPQLSTQANAQTGAQLNKPDAHNAYDTPISNVETTQRLSYLEFLRHNPRFVCLIVGFSFCFFMQQLLMSYAALIVADVGGDAAVQGNALAIQAASELPAMWLMEILTRKVKIGNIMRFGAAGYIAKHAVIVFAVLVSSVSLLYLGYGLQAISYAVFTAANVYYCNVLFDEGNKNKAIGLCYMVNTISGILGNFIGGILVDGFGLYVMLVSGLVLTIVGSLFAMMGAQNPKTLKQ